MPISASTTHRIDDGFRSLEGVSFSTNLPTNDAPNFSCLNTREIPKAWNIPVEGEGSQEFVRKCVKLPQLNPELVECAKFLAREIGQDWQEASAFYDRTKIVHSSTLLELSENIECPKQRQILQKAVEQKQGTGNGIALRVRNTTIDRFEQTFCEHLEKYVDGNPRDMVSYQNLLTLTAYFCQRSPLAPSGFLNRLPNGMFESKEEASQVEQRISILLRLVFSCAEQVLPRSGKIKTAYDLEKYPKLALLVTSARLSVLNKMIPVQELPEKAFPGISSRGLRPVVRTWMIEHPRKSSNKQLLAQACADAMCFGGAQAGELGVKHTVTEDGKANVVFDFEQMSKVQWNAVFCKNGLKHHIGRDGLFRTSVEALDAGAKFLGKADLIGFESGQLSPVKIDVLSRWVGKSGLKKLDLVSARVLDRVRDLYPEVFLYPDENYLNPYKVARNIPWSALYLEIGKECLRCTGYKASSALARIIPESFGYLPFQVKPWSFKRTNTWSGSEGKEKLRSQLAYGFWDKGLGTFKIEDSSLKYRISKTEFDVWAKTTGLTTLDSLHHFFQQQNLHGALNEAVSDRTSRNAIRIFVDLSEEPCLHNPIFFRARENIAMFNEALTEEGEIVVHITEIDSLTAKKLSQDLLTYLNRQEACGVLTRSRVYNARPSMHSHLIDYPQRSLAQALSKLRDTNSNVKDLFGFLLKLDLECGSVISQLVNEARKSQGFSLETSLQPLLEAVFPIVATDSIKAIQVAKKIKMLTSFCPDILACLEQAVDIIRVDPIRKSTFALIEDTLLIVAKELRHMKHQEERFTKLQSGLAHLQF